MVLYIDLYWKKKVVSPLAPNKGASPPRLTGHGFWLWQVAGCRGWYQGLRFVSTLEQHRGRGTSELAAVLLICLPCGCFFGQFAHIWILLRSGRVTGSLLSVYSLAVLINSENTQGEGGLAIESGRLPENTPDNICFAGLKNPR